MIDLILKFFVAIINEASYKTEHLSSDCLYGKFWAQDRYSENPVRRAPKTFPTS